MVIHLSEFKHQSVRDLAWAISSPPLVSNLSNACVWPESDWYQRIYKETLPWLNIVDSDPAELDELLAAQKDRRLGKYFETLWFYWFKHHQRYEIIENNLQIIIDGETLGEIDFIVFDKILKQTIHWEVATKFYLGVGDTRKMNNWHGPNLRDRLDIKVQHLLQRQSMITKNQRVSLWLKQQGLYIEQCAVILKGRLYYPWERPEQYLNQENILKPRLSPAQCSSQHLYSWWFKQSQFDRVFDSEQCFKPLINEGWLEKIPTSTEGQFYDKNEIFKTISNNVIRLPLLVQLCNHCHRSDRVFLVDEDWPKINS